MLRELHIKNIAVIEEITVEFENGFQVLTGETGAGKSILIDSIDMALGGRGNRELIRTGADFASVDLAFEVDNNEIMNKLDELGIECEDCTIVISRKLFPDGRSKSHINGRLIPLNVVREVGALLLTIHGQNDNQTILMPKSHINFVDMFGGYTDIIDTYKSQYEVVSDIKKELESLETDEREKDRLTELLSFQIDEISSAKLKEGEEEALEERRSFLQNAEQITEAAGGAYYLLHGGDEMGSGACDALGDALRKLEGVKDYDGNLARFYETLSAVMADVEDVTYELHSYVDGIDYSQYELDEAEARLSLINSLKRKYGGNISEILAYEAKSRERLSAIEDSDERKRELLSKLLSEEEILESAAQNLTNKRIETALCLQERIMNELADLDMQKMRFSVSVSPLIDPDGSLKYTPNGCDSVEFLISANPGEALKPLAKIASGGEMSRIMLALKSVLADADQIETLIFDEIDTGVSGRAAQKIAEKMGVLARKRQLLCITHLSQLAAMADYHYLIEKKSSGEKTNTYIRLIDGEERVDELARITGGVKVTDLTRNAANEMLDMAASYKRQLKADK